MDKRIHSQTQAQRRAQAQLQQLWSVQVQERWFFFFANPAATSSPNAVRWPVGDGGEGSRLAPEVAEPDVLVKEQTASPTPSARRPLPSSASFFEHLSVRQKSILSPPTITKVWFSSYNYKTGYFTSLNFSNRAFYLPRAVLKTVCYSNRSFVFF